MKAFFVSLASTLVYPLGIALFLLLVLLVLVWRRSRLALPVLLVVIAVLWLGSMPITANKLAWALESEYPPLNLEEYPAVDAIIVLGGAVNGGMRRERPIELGPAADRVYYAALLYKLGKAQTVLCSGGNQPWIKRKMTEAEAMKDMLLNLGVPEEAILIEGGSINTRENALKTAEILEKRGIGKVMLVTSASHMPRAMGVFSKAGIDAVAVPVDYSSVKMKQTTLLDYLPSAGALWLTSKMVKEYAGTLYYRLQGWI